MSLLEHVCKLNLHKISQMTRKSYPSDISDSEWQVLEPHFAQFRETKAGRPRLHPLREIVNAIFYQSRVGCPWRYLPHDFPPHEAVSASFYRWQEANSVEKLHHVLREKVRQQAGRSPTPTALILDSQSVKTAGKRGAVTVTMRARKSLAESGLRLLIPKV